MDGMQTYLLLGLTLLVLYSASKFLQWKKAVDSIQNFPGLRYPLGPEAFLLPWTIPYVSAGNRRYWRLKHKDFADRGVDIISSVNVFPNPKAMYILADAEVLKEVTNSRARFPKPTSNYTILKFYGSNIVVTEDDEWKRHRKITAPAFSERNTRLVWDETLSILDELTNMVWAGKEEVNIDNIVDLTVPIALFVIGVAGFGRRMSWMEDIAIPAGHSMAFKDALHTVSTDIAYKVVLPTWLLKLGPTQRIRNFRIAYDELATYMVEMIRARKTSEKKEERFDLFSSLLNANEEGVDGTPKLNDEELMGNIFIYLIAGHETTAHTLAFTFILLALYQDEQEIVYQHIKSIVSDDRLPTYEDMGKLTYCLAVFYETLRLFPPACVIPKFAREDMTLVTRNTAGEAVSVPCPAGTRLLIHIAGLHYNPRYWEDPYAFKPARFLEDWPRDAFLPFSSGARSCLGRRFSETEAVAILTYMIANFKVEVKEEPKFASETFEQRKERLTNARSAITLYPLRAPLVFKRRHTPMRAAANVV